MFIALAGLVWNVNSGFDHVHEHMDRLQTETSPRFDAIEGVLRIFERRIFHKEGGKGPGTHCQRFAASAIKQIAI